MKNVLIFVEEGYEDLELQYPKYRLIEAGAKVTIAGPKAKATYTGKKGYPCLSDITFDDVKVADYDALIIPGGHAPDKLRMVPKVLEITKEFDAQKKLIAFICHAGWVPVSAKIIKGIKCTSYAAIKDDMINAGALWEDAPMVQDKHFISSRKPDDLPAFCAQIVKQLKL